MFQVETAWLHFMGLIVNEGPPTTEQRKANTIILTFELILDSILSPLWKYHSWSSIWRWWRTGRCLRTAADPARSCPPRRRWRGYGLGKGRSADRTQTSWELHFSALWFPGICPALFAPAGTRTWTCRHWKMAGMVNETQKRWPSKGGLVTYLERKKFSSSFLSFIISSVLSNLGRDFDWPRALLAVPAH